MLAGSLSQNGTMKKSKTVTASAPNELAAKDKKDIENKILGPEAPQTPSLVLHDDFVQVGDVQQARNMGLALDNNLVAISTTHMDAQTPSNKRFETVVLKTLGKICKRLNKLEQQVDVLQDFEELTTRFTKGKDCGEQRKSHEMPLQVNVANRSENEANSQQPLEQDDNPPNAQILIVTNHIDGEAQAQPDQLNEHASLGKPSEGKLTGLIEGLQKATQSQHEKQSQHGKHSQNEKQK